jgi:hypothetical protein
MSSSTATRCTFIGVGPGTFYDWRFSEVEGGWRIDEARVCGDRSWYRRLTDEQERDEIDRLITLLFFERQIDP